MFRSQESRGGGRGRGTYVHRGSWRGNAASSWGQGAGRGRSGNFNYGPPSRAQVKLSEETLGSLVMSFSKEAAEESIDKGKLAKIVDCRYAGSYSWIASPSPKISIPGQAAAWSPPELPIQLPVDKGNFPRDQNGAHFPQYPLQPSVQALFSLNRDFDPSEIDVVGCASSLGELLRFARGIESTFRFDIERVGNTLFFARNHGNEMIPNVWGYGHTFLDKFTTHDAEFEQTESHQRIVSYTFGGLRMLVRFECDAFLPRHDAKDTRLESPGDLEALEGAAAHSIPVQAGGKIAPQESLLEIKTRSEKSKPVDLADHLPRLWVRQLPNLVAGYHQKGEFKSLDFAVDRARLDMWEDEHKEDIQIFLATLRKIIVESKQHSHPRLEVCRSLRGPLELRERKGESSAALPDYWKARWKRDPDGAPDGTSDSDSSDGGHEKWPTNLGPPTLTALADNAEDQDKDEADDEDDDFALDYTGCTASCGYCGTCV